MRKYTFITTLLLFTVLTHAQPTGKTVYITHAQVVNVITQKIDADQTVVIDQDRITAIGPSKKIKVPADGVVIDATGQYLMPGMTDAHIHFFQSGGLYTRPDALNLNSVYSYEKDQRWIKDNLNDLMARYLACGITTVIDVGGPMSNYAIRSRLDTTQAAPNALVTGPLISTYLPPNLDKNDPPIVKVTTEQEARDLVKKQLPYKPDFIKIWYIVLPNQPAESTLPIVKAAIEESHANHLKVCVHATEYQTARLAVEAGADILVHSVDDKVLDNDMLQLLKTKNIVYIPTLVVMENYYRTFSQQFSFTPHDLAYANPFMLGTQMDLQHLNGRVPFDYMKARARFKIPSKEDSTMLTNLKLAQNAGVLVVAGTDAGNIGTHHAASLQDELLAMKQAGLTNWNIITAATINAAKGFGKEKDYGSIEKGKKADLLLLRADPTGNLDITGNLQTVFHRGVYYNAASLVPVTPEILVQQQLNGYNARNIDAFLAPYSNDVAMYDLGGRLLMKGKEQLRQHFGQLFTATPALHCELVNRMVHGDTIIDHEKVTGTDKPLEAFVVYKISGNKIATVHFIQ
jgi:imidazolonepropionase-like amidohydrolase